jgi:phenylpropionate dioxygenase-like ring-hydroxylating dioxygenase large terminal subunit
VLALDRLVDHADGWVNNEVYSSEEIYQLELERVFGRCWLFVGHESMIPNAGDYIANYLGEDPVIVCRDEHGKVRVFLNKCRHRGNRVCLFDKGHASVFTCSYHGWAYDTEGALVGVPSPQEAYHGELKREGLGLVEVPKVANYGGLLFACWDAGAMSLDDYLGDLKWYLDNFLLMQDLGGLEIIPGKERYMMPVNWKLLAENFAGDDYHFQVTHASVVKVLTKAQNARIVHGPMTAEPSKGREFSVVVGHGTGVPHGLLELKIGARYYEHDLAQAEPMGAEAVDWIKTRYRRLQERLRGIEPMPYSFHVGNIFPSLALIGAGTAMYGRGLILWQPRGPQQTEVWQWCAVEKDAPKVIKERMIFVLMQRQAAAGLVAPDDHENFARVGQNVRTKMAKRWPFHYGMGIGHERADDGDGEWPLDRLPGLVAPQYSEVSQREFYRYWNELITR